MEINQALDTLAEFIRSTREGSKKRKEQAEKAFERIFIEVSALQDKNFLLRKSLDEKES